MSKMSKAIVALGVVAGLGVAALPLSSYAASQQPRQAQVEVEVGGTISLEFANGDGNADTVSFDATTNTLKLGPVMMGGGITSEAIKATVKSNDPIGYTLSIRATNEGKMINSLNDNAVIETNDLSGTKGWGYKVGDGAYKALPTTDQVIVGKDDAVADSVTAETTGGNGTQEDPATASTNVTFGVKADATVPEGTYTGTVIFTAAVK